jgi:putative membrane protein
MDWAFALFYFFGLLGIALPGYRNLFLPLSPLNLILTLSFIK